MHPVEYRILSRVSHWQVRCEASHYLSSKVRWLYWLVDKCLRSYKVTGR